MADQARALADAGAHADAARGFLDVVDAAGRDRATAAQAAMLAADAWRRDDRPEAARRAADRALALPMPPAMRAVVQIGRAAAAMDLGDLAGAATDVEAALALDAGPKVAVVLLDTAVGLALALGDLATAATRTAALAAVAPAAARAAVDFRRAALARLGGDLPAARGLLVGVVEGGRGNPAWAGPVAAATSELGELLLLEGDTAQAKGAFADAASAWRAAGRRSAEARAAAGLVRAALASGERPPGRALDAHVDMARERGLVLVEAEVRLARGALRHRHHVSGAEADLDAAVSLAQGAGARLLEGQARLTRLAAGVRRADDLRARVCLAGDQPGLARLAGLTAG